MATVYVQDGEEVVVDLIDTPTWYIGWGEGVGGAVKGDADLGTPSTEARVAGANTQPAADINQWVGTITADGSKTIEEVGLFDCAGVGSPPAGGSLIIRHNLAAGVAVEALDTIEFTITLEQT